MDGAPIITTVVEGTGAYGYSNGELTSRVKVTKQASISWLAYFPELADLDDPQSDVNTQARAAAPCSVRIQV